ncbi:hypothetical protein BCR33DRAFT_717337, partial [Rhizoclosmatium globosum]
MAFLVKEGVSTGSASNLDDTISEAPSTSTRDSIVKRGAGISQRRNEKASSKNYKVTLGSFQSCNCHSYLTENDICVHILWVMIKVFRINPENEMLYQNSLIEREIIELMESRKKKNPVATSPICMEDLDVRTGAITYCKLSCGNNLHVKCMKVLMDHQTKNMGLENVKCPLCRKDFGKYEELKKELAEGFSHHIKIENQSRHYGVSCSECSETPIFGKCHRCCVCKEFGVTCHLCDKCYTAGCHSQHDQFRHRLTRSSKWVPSKRTIQPMLSETQIQDIQNRELTAETMKLFLLLQPTPSGMTPLHIISTFPTRIITYGDPLLRATVIPTPSSYGSPSVLPMKPKCDVCLASYTPGDINCKSTCPTCSAPALILRLFRFEQMLLGFSGQDRKKLGRANGYQDHGMVIVGTGSTSTPPTLSNPSKSKTQRKPKTGPTKTRPTKLPPLFANLSLGPPQATLPPASQQQKRNGKRRQVECLSSQPPQIQPLLFDDLIISRSLRRGGPATAAESETGVVPTSSSKPAGPSAFKTSLQKRRFLPHTNLSVIEKGPVNLDSLVECHKYKLQQVVQRHGGIVLPQSPVEAVSGEVSGVGQVIVSRASIGSRRS